MKKLVIYIYLTFFITFLSVGTEGNPHQGTGTVVDISTEDRTIVVKDEVSGKLLIVINNRVDIQIGDKVVYIEVLRPCCENPIIIVTDSPD